VWLKEERGIEGIGLLERGASVWARGKEIAF